eukprot:gene17399-19142_t
MAKLCVFITAVVAVANVLALDYVIDPEKKASTKEDFQGIGIGLVSRPAYCERTTQRGDKLTVHFNASMADGKVFETTFKKSPFEFVIGNGQVITGFEYGLMDMCIGEKRRLTVPSKYAYGSTTFGAKVPGRITLYFDVELLDFQRMQHPPRKSNIFRVIDVNDDGLLSKEEVQKYVRNNRIDDNRGESGITQVLKEIFQEEDRDRDGFIDHGEFSGVKHDEF